jgi:hypothetical protein
VIDIIDRIDDVTASVCGWCSTKLTADNYSGDFCSEAHQESWNRDRAGLTVTEPRTVDVVLRSPGGDAIVVEIAVDMSHFENTLRVARESMGRFHRAVEIAGRRMGRAAGIPDRFLTGDWTDFGFTAGGVTETTRAADHPPAPTRAERMQAALDAHRNRNTGPTHRPRAPKNLGGRTPR